MISFTEHPFLEAPEAQEIVWLYENNLPLLKKLHKAHEGRIEASVSDPIRHGFDLPGWERIREGLSTHNECLALGGNRSGKTTGFAKIVMESVTGSMDGH